MLEDIPIKEQGARPPPQVTTRAPGLVAAHTGMRGLLALWIVIFHSLFYSVGWNLHGSALIPLFFLLSGYSLAIGYGKNKYKSRLKDDDLRVCETVPSLNLGCLGLSTADKARRLCDKYLFVVSWINATETW